MIIVPENLHPQMLVECILGCVLDQLKCSISGVERAISTVASGQVQLHANFYHPHQAFSRSF